MPQRQTTKKIASDEVQGEGSYVVLQAMSYGVIKDAGRSNIFAEDGTLREATSDERLSVIDKVIIDSIVEWNWVDSKGDPLPTPKTSEDLDQLLNTEIKFLSDHIQSRGTEDRKNSESG